MCGSGCRLSLGRSLPGLSCAAKGQKVSETLGGQQAFSLMVVSMEAVSCFVILSPVRTFLLSSFSEADVFVSSVIPLDYPGACPKVRSSFLFPFFPFYFFMLVLGLLGWSPA